MFDLTEHPIATRYPAAHPDRLQLYSFPTPNGVKVSIMLEEAGLPYEVHTVKLSETTEPEFLALNPNNKIPAIIDPDGPGGRPLPLFESGAILIYLADKTGALMPADPAERYRVIQWLMFQMGGVGPMFGQIGFFHKFAGKDIPDPRPKERFVNEARRLLGVIEGQLGKQPYLAGDAYTIADLATWPWVRTLSEFYEVDDLVEMHRFPKVRAWAAAAAARPASQAGLDVPPRDA